MAKMLCALSQLERFGVISKDLDEAASLCRRLKNGLPCDLFNGLRAAADEGDRDNFRLGMTTTLSDRKNRDPFLNF